MITFRQGERQFVFRTVGVMVQNGRVLLHRANGNDFWSLPGGRVEFLEKAESAIVREMGEELEVDVTVERLLWVVENFFETGDISCHELALYFLLNLPDNCPIRYKTGDFYGQDEIYKGKRTSLIFHWFALYQLEMLTLYPDFLKTSLQALPRNVRHIAHVGNGNVIVT